MIIPSSERCFVSCSHYFSVSGNSLISIFTGRFGWKIRKISGYYQNYTRFWSRRVSLHLLLVKEGKSTSACLFSHSNEGKLGMLSAFKNFFSVLGTRILVRYCISISWICSPCDDIHTILFHHNSNRFLIT